MAHVLCIPTIQPCTSSQCHFIQSRVHRVHVCLVVTSCHLYFWQNGQDLLHAPAVTEGWNGYPNKSQHRKLTTANSPITPGLPGLKPKTFRSQVQHSTTELRPIPRDSLVSAPPPPPTHTPTPIYIYAYICWHIFIHTHHTWHTHTHTHTHTNTHIHVQVATLLSSLQPFLWPLEPWGNWIMHAWLYKLLTSATVLSPDCSRKQH